MGNRLPHGLGGLGHWLDLLGGGEGEGQRLCLLYSAQFAIVCPHCLN
jgi:hypothetical protein